MTTPDSPDAQIAIYWDFENVHAAMIDALHGPGAWRKTRFHSQEALIEVPAVVDYAASLGSIVVNRAYGNWHRFGRYADAFLTHAVELIQLFPPGANGKNGADIRLACDVAQDLQRLPHITHVVIVGGDSDFIPVAQMCRRLGRVMLGVGVEGSVNRFWATSCSEFKHYRTLLGKTGADSRRVRDSLRVEADASEARALLVRGIQALMSATGEDFVRKAALKPMMLRLESTFDEGSYGFDSFNGFLRDCADLIVVTPGAHDHEIRLAASPRATPTAPASPEPPSRSWQPASPPLAAEYVRTLKQQGSIRLVEPAFRRDVFRSMLSVFERSPGNRISSFDELMDGTLADLASRGITARRSDPNKVRQVLLKFRLFALEAGSDDSPGAIGVQDGMTSVDALEAAYCQGVVGWLLHAIQPPLDIDIAALLLFGADGGPDAVAWVRSAVAEHEVG